MKKSFKNWKIRKSEDRKIRKSENQKIRKLENQKIRKPENQKTKKSGTKNQNLGKIAKSENLKLEHRKPMKNPKIGRSKNQKNRKAGNLIFRKLEFQKIRKSEYQKKISATAASAKLESYMFEGNKYREAHYERIDIAGVIFLPLELPGSKF